MSHVEATELLGAYALDAMEGEERDALERHTEGCPACQEEILGHREVAGLLTPGWAKAPEVVWERIAAALEEAPPPLDLAPVIAMRPSAPKRTRSLGIAAVAAAVAASVIAVLGLKVVDDGHRINQLAQGVHSEELQRTVNAALVDPNARQVDLRSPDGAVAVQAVLLQDGTGYLVRDNLPALPPERTYQLWAMVGTSRISVGVLGPDPQISAFKADGPLWGLAITSETAGGVVTTARDPVVLGRIQEA